MDKTLVQSDTRCFETMTILEVIGKYLSCAAEGFL